MKLFPAKNYKIVHHNQFVSLYDRHEEMVKVMVDCTDNRTTLAKLHPGTPPQALKLLTRYLDEHFGGKQVFIIPNVQDGKFDQIKEALLAEGFSNKPAEKPATARLRVTDVRHLQAMPQSLLPADFSGEHGFSWQVGMGGSGAADEASVLNLMRNANFQPTLMNKYETQGFDGFKLRCEYALTVEIYHKDKGLVGFCRATPLINGNYYLGDTWVNQEVLGLTQGAAALYHCLGNWFNGSHSMKELKTRLYLIAPATREQEFDQNYGCRVPTNTFVKFGPANDLELDRLFESEKRRAVEASAEREQAMELSL